MRALSIFAIFLLPIIAGVIKDVILGHGPIWPYLLAASAIAMCWDWKAGLLIGLGIGIAEYVTVSFNNPDLWQFLLYTVLAFAAFGLAGSIPAVTLALVALIYLAIAVGGVAWFPGVVATEFILTFGLMGVVINGPSGGIRAGILEQAANGRTDDFAGVHVARRLDDSEGIEGDPQAGPGRSR